MGRGLPESGGLDHRTMHPRHWRGKPNVVLCDCPRLRGRGGRADKIVLVVFDCRYHGHHTRPYIRWGRGCSSGLAHDLCFARFLGHHYFLQRAHFPPGDQSCSRQQGCCRSKRATRVEVEPFQLDACCFPGQLQASRALHVGMAFDAHVDDHLVEYAIHLGQCLGHPNDWDFYHYVGACIVRAFGEWLVLLAPKDHDDLAGLKDWYDPTRHCRDYFLGDWLDIHGAFSQGFLGTPELIHLQSEPHHRASPFSSVAALRGRSWHCERPCSGINWAVGRHLRLHPHLHVPEHGIPLLVARPGSPCCVPSSVLVELGWLVPRARRGFPPASSHLAATVAAN
mmetsp:Transcript_112690/g.283326  ORF Transcript_112690/g.283326 Transcript_112690/m.283326 type:complete len:338 (+) Transcript_112690:917-1930(+)